jgi:hypothetical protein
MGQKIGTAGSEGHQFPRHQSSETPHKEGREQSSESDQAGQFMLNNLVNDLIKTNIAPSMTYALFAPEIGSET